MLLRVNNQQQTGVMMEITLITLTLIVLHKKKGLFYPFMKNVFMFWQSIKNILFK